MKIYTLGTSHGDPTRERFNTSTLYEIGGSYYLFDAGEPVEALMVRKGLDIGKIRAVFITHLHPDHVSGIFNLLKHYIKYPPKNDDGSKKSVKMNIFFPEERAIEPFLSWCSVCLAERYVPNDENCKLGVTKEGSVYSDENITVNAFPNRHIKATDGNPRSFSYIVSAEGKKILHTGDLDKNFSDFPFLERLGRFDACICEAQHYSHDEALPYFAEADFGKLVFIHVADRYHGVDGEKKLLSGFEAMKYPALVAHDGDEFEV